MCECVREREREREREKYLTIKKVLPFYLQSCRKKDFCNRGGIRMTKNFFPYRKTQKERIKEKFERVWRNSLPKQLKVKYLAAAVEADSGQYHNILGYSTTMLGGHW